MARAGRISILEGGTDSFGSCAAFSDSDGVAGGGTDPGVGVCGGLGVGELIVFGLVWGLPACGEALYREWIE